MEQGAQVPLEPQPPFLPGAFVGIRYDRPRVVHGSVESFFHADPSRSDRPAPIVGLQRDVVANRGRLDLCKGGTLPGLVRHETDVVHGREIQGLGRHQILSGRNVPEVVDRQGDGDLVQFIRLGGREHALEAPHIRG